MDSADLKNVGKIAGKNDRQLDSDWILAVIANSQPLIERAVRDKGCPYDMQRVLFQDELIVDKDVWVGQIDI